MDESVLTPSSNRNHWTVEDIRKTIEQTTVVVFAKGTEDHPRCGFSEMVFSAIRRTGRPFQVVDVSEERSIVPALRKYSGNSHLPHIYVNGSLVTSSDTLESVLESGELDEKLDEAFHS